MNLALLAALTVAGDAGALSHMRLQAAVVVASTEGRDIASVLRPLERRLRTLLPYTSYRGFTEYTASLGPGESLNLRLPDGRAVQLTPSSAEAVGSVRQAVHVAIERGEDFESTVTCSNATVFQIRNATADKSGDRTFLVYLQDCPGSHPQRLMPDGP